MFEIFIILTCLLLNAFLACAETAFVSLSKPHLRELAKRGDKKAERLLGLREKPERTLSVIQVGITFLGALAAAAGGVLSVEVFMPLIMSWLGGYQDFANLIAILIIVIPWTYINVVFGELVPKTLALRNAYFFASKTSGALNIFRILINPVIFLLEKSTRIIADFLDKFFHVRLKKEEKTDEEMILLDTLGASSKQYVLNIVKMQGTKVSAVMIPWENVDHLDEQQSRVEVEDIIIATGHTRLPVLSGEKILGILHTKEFLAFQKIKTEKSWTSLIRSSLNVQQDASILEAIQMMQEKRTHMSIVYSEKGKIGVVTMEDIIEEIVGDIYDEDDDGTIIPIARNKFIN